MTALIALVGVALLVGITWIGVGSLGMATFFGVVVPYAAIALFLIGFVYRVIKWARAPVPFRITTTCGQQKSLPFIKHERFESPHSFFDVFGRMFLEVLLFRSLFRNTKSGLTKEGKITYVSDKLLWMGALAFHWSFLLIFIRHLRFFMEPTPKFIFWIEQLDGFFQLAVPTFFISNAVIIGALLFLLGRRLFDSKVRYISLASDYFALFLLLGVAISGVFMRYVTKVNVAEVKQIALGLVTFDPYMEFAADSGVMGAAGVPFFIHLVLVSALFAYFPYSKLMHMAGVFMSPTRNLANNNRARRHVNPWNPTTEEVHAHTYAEWEDDFRDKLKAVGYRLESEGE